MSDCGHSPEHRVRGGSQDYGPESVHQGDEPPAWGHTAKSHPSDPIRPCFAYAVKALCPNVFEVQRPSYLDGPSGTTPRP